MCEFAEIEAQIDAGALRHNLAALRGCCRPGTWLCAALKADAYGHGLGHVAPILERGGVEFAAVANLDEAIRLRATGWKRPVLVLGVVLSVDRAAARRERIGVAMEHGLTLTLVDDAPLDEMNAAARAFGRTLDVHLKLDTGMGRMGLKPEHGMDVLRRLREFGNLRLAGVYSHFGTADLSDHALVDQQLAEYREFLKRSEIGDSASRGGVIRHLANTAATMTRADAHFDMVRPGIGLYGLMPADGFSAKAELRPAMRVVSRVSAVKELPSGHCVGYGCTFRTERRSRIGNVPAGYHDGFVRALSNRAVVGTAHGDAPVVGRISMDQMAVDLTDLPGVRAGSEVVLLDERPERPNSVANTARLLGTISYEIICGLGGRIKRVLVERAGI